jgi:hypothetical protein
MLAIEPSTQHVAPGATRHCLQASACGRDVVLGLLGFGLDPGRLGIACKPQAVAATIAAAHSVRHTWHPLPEPADMQLPWCSILVGMNS